MMKRFSQFILRHAGVVSIVGSLIGFVGAYYSVHLYMNLRTNLEEMLPTNARSVLDLNEVTSRLEAIDNLAVLIFSDDTKASKRFVQDFVARVEKLPHENVSSVEYKIDKELEFFHSRATLYMDVKDLTGLRDYIRDRVSYEKQLYNPLNIFSEHEIPEPKFDFTGLQTKYNKRTSAYDRFPDGYYATPDGKKRAVLVYLNGKTANFSQVMTLKRLVKEQVDALNPKSYAPDMEVKYTGGVQDTIEEQLALMADLEKSSIVVTLLVTIAMLVFFKNVRATFALIWSLFMGTFWTFGLSYFTVGYLNANSAFMGSIVLGNGINFGIIVLARYLEERRAGRDALESGETAMTQTATATWTAAAAAGLSYGSLVLTGFRGFRQFGVIGLTGMVLCWVSAFTLLPAYLAVLERWKPLVKPTSKPPGHSIAGVVASAVSHFPRFIWFLSVAATVLALVMCTRYSPDILETNLAKLRNKDSMEHGSAFLSKYLDDIFNRYLSPMVVLPKTREQAREIASALKKEKEEQGPGSLIANVQTLDDFVPDHQQEKIAVLRQIKKLLPDQILQRLSDDDQKKVNTLLNPKAFKPIQERELPTLVINKFTEKDGSIGKMVLVEPPLGNVTWSGPKLFQFIGDIRRIADGVSPETAVAGTTPTTSDMLQAVSRDGPRATLFAIVSVITLVVVIFRDFRTVALTLFALAMGVTWLGGIILGFWLKINFLNFIALPITFGIGVDYGVNMFQRYKQEGGGNIANIIRHTGGAVGLCSFTTVVGYCSLLIAGNQGFVSFGRLAVAGELTCVTAAVVSLPAFLLWLSKRQEKRLASTAQKAQA